MAILVNLVCSLSHLFLHLFLEMSLGTITRILELQKGSNFEGKSMNEINGVLELQEGLILKEQVP